MTLPAWIEKPLNMLVAQVFPQLLRQPDANMTAEQTAKLNTHL